jgi:outer membrane protein
MKKGNKKWEGMIILMLLPVMLMSQTPDTTRIIRHELSIQQAVDYANANNVEVKNALIDVLLQKETNRQVTAQAYPNISASGSVTNNLKLQTTLLPGELVGQPTGTFVPVTFGTKYITNASADLRQLLFDGQVFVGLQARKTSIDWAEKNVEVTQEMIKTNIHKVYYQLVVSKTQVELIDANIALLDTLRRNTKAMYDNGFVAKIDIDRVDVRLANLHTEKERVLAGIANGYYGLKVLMGMPIRDELILTDSLSHAQIREGVLENSIFQYDDRKDYQYLQLTKKFNEFNIRRYKLSKIPTLSLEASYSKQHLENEFKFRGQWFTASYIALRVNVPIFSGFATNSRIEQSRLTVRQLDNQIEATKINIDNEVLSARNNFRTAISAMDAQLKNMQLAESIYQQTKKMYEEGLAESIDLTGAQADLKAAQTNYINALYDAVIAKTDLLRATGKL